MLGAICVYIRPQQIQILKYKLVFAAKKLLDFLNKCIFKYCKNGLKLLQSLRLEREQWVHMVNGST